MRPSLRNNALVILSFVAFLVVLVATSVMIDVQYYQPAKTILILDQYFADRPLRSARFSGHVMDYLNTLTFLDMASTDPEFRSRNESSFREGIRRKLELEKRRKDSPLIGVVLPDDPREAMETMLLAFVDEEMRHPNSPLVRFEIRRDGQVILERERGDDALRHTFRNSLLTRDFDGEMKQPFLDLRRPNAPDDWMIDTFTSPLHYAPVEDLTRRYWRYLGYLLLGVTLAYLLVLRFVVLPIKNVAVAIQESRGRAPRFIAKPRAGLERLYNSMARDASLTALRIGLHGPGSQRLRTTIEEVFEYLGPRVTEWFGFEDMWLLDLEWAGPDLLTPVRQIPAPHADSPPAWESVAAAFDKALVRNLRTSWESGTPHVFSCPASGNCRALFAAAMPRRGQEEEVQVLVLVPGKEGAATSSWYHNTAEGLYAQLITIVEQQDSQARELLREKGEANISLSRNLGHDLTNVVATNKIELMTVAQVLRGDPSTWGNTPEKAEIVQESIGCLLDNTRSLQEIVNLYRAYEYLKSPRYEETDLTVLAREIIGVFKLSMSAHVEIETDWAGEMPLVELEPRLVKLAVFNLLSNAQDAVRRLSTSRQPHAKILVQTLWDHVRDGAVIRVADTGTGIRTPDGDLAGDEEIKRIFDLGYTTKLDGAGEGLGLNWVRTILTDFHDGSLTARNRKQGGAEFECFLPRAARKPKTGSPSES